MHASRAFCAAPRHVYAGVISNKTITLDAGGRACIPEQEYKPTPEATFTCRKVVSRIEVHDDEKTYALEQPFDGVTCPVTEWRFDLHDDHIASVNPTTLATPTQLENPVIAQ
ncbi:unnamed protein product [Rotaria socialis]